MKKIVLKFFLIICCTLLLTSLVSASTMQYTRFTEFKPLNFSSFDADTAHLENRFEYRYVMTDSEEIQNFLNGINMRESNNSQIVQIEIFVVKEGEAKINPIEKTYLRNITKHEKGFFKNEIIESSGMTQLFISDIDLDLNEEDTQSDTEATFTTYQDRKVAPYLRNTAYVPNFIILKNIIPNADKTLETSSECSYCGNNDVVINVWDLYTFVTFETYNIFKNEWETGELYIPEGTLYMAVEYKKID
jgi:hypothetical protein